MGFKHFVPEPLKIPYRRIRSSLDNKAFGNKSPDVFNEIYRRKAWGSSGNSDLYSGSGTYDKTVPDYVNFITDFIKERAIKNIYEVGCGDFFIANQYAHSVESYLAIDASELIVQRNTEKFGGDRISFVHGDAGTYDAPPSDLCIIRQVLQHLDNETILRILNRVSVHRFVLVTEHLPSPNVLQKPNVNKRIGPDTRLGFNSGVYVELPPFNRQGETVLTLPLTDTLAHPDEILRTTLLTNF